MEIDHLKTQGPRILVGICSCAKYADKRQAVRETWLSREEPGITSRFFVGRSGTPVDEADTDEVDADDSYDYLPEKVLAFFRHALAHHEFEWLFKCDDDTYVSLDRLRSLVKPGFDLIGSRCLEARGAPSGGAGYLVSRQMVERLVADATLPAVGAEDLIVGHAVSRLGGRSFPDWRLGLREVPFPSSDNEFITAHWCQPARLRAIDALFNRVPVKTSTVRHRHWWDRVHFYQDGFFVRQASACSGTWEKDATGKVALQWFEWPVEFFTPGAAVEETEEIPAVLELVEHAVRTVSVRLMGGLGNQMFQYAHGLALARRLGAGLHLGWSGGGRSFGLGLFGLECGPALPGGESFRDEGSWQGGDWPALAAARRAESDVFTICGYFQNERFFAPVANEIRACFHLEPELGLDAGGRTPVCVHVRRGDFVGRAVHDLCSAAYFASGIRLMRSMVDDPLFVVVSDDPEWCKAAFEGEPDLVVMPLVPPGRAMRTMMACKAFIICNSTFSWWGAWLSRAPVVIAPNRFLADREWPICPEAWIQIPVGGLPSEVKQEKVFASSVPAEVVEEGLPARRYMAIITFGRSGSTMLQCALNASPGVLVRGENHNLPYGCFLTQDAAERAARKTWPNSGSKDPWFGAGDIPTERVLAGQRDLMIDCVLRPEADTVLCGWKEIRHVPWSKYFSNADLVRSPRDFDDLVAYLVFLDRMFPGIRFLINTRDPASASRSGWWAEDPVHSQELLTTATGWLHALPGKLEEQLGRKAATVVEYENWSRDPDCLQAAWGFLGIPWQAEMMGSLFKERVNKGT